MLLDEYGVPMMVQDIHYSIAISLYYVKFFDGQSFRVFSNKLNNHYQVQHSFDTWGVRDFSPIISELEELWRVCQKDPMLWKEWQ